MGAALIESRWTDIAANVPRLGERVSKTCWQGSIPWAAVMIAMRYRIETLQVEGWKPVLALGYSSPMHFESEKDARQYIEQLTDGCGPLGQTRIVRCPQFGR